MVEEKGGWFVVNVQDAPWYERQPFGRHIEFESPDDPRWGEIEPSKWPLA